MQISLPQQLKQGRQYIEFWPAQPELLNYFAEYRAVIVSRFVLKYGAPLAALAFLLPLLFIGVEQLKQALFYALFIGSLPVQSLFLMYNKSKEPLPPSLKGWYKNGVEKIKDKPADTEFSVIKPTFLDLAKLLHFSYNR
ncbi:hypothetical protein A9Q98_02860 [Thalassotalea sp. 42_200_T64]|nr:hypothetical protein A9Q98_02860 [Thalassotalea sp. 42_200_T64]